MLAQFLDRYPTGSLVSELLTIYQGKFVVRVAAQVEGVVRTTGMAVSESLELAEDQARSRALMVLGIGLTQKTGEQKWGDGEVEDQEENVNTGNSDQLSLDPLHPIAPDAMTVARRRSHSVEDSISSPLSKTAARQFEANLTRLPNQGDPLVVTGDQGVESPPGFAVSYGEAGAEGGSPSVGNRRGQPSSRAVSPQATGSPDLFSWDQVDAPVENGNVTPLAPRNYSEEITGTLDQKDAETTMEASEPIDLSDAIARTSVELKRLGWGNQQGREYLKQTYNKRSRQELTDQEMLEFLHYLESQPSQSEPFA